MSIYPFERLPDYYPTMHKDGYTPQEVYWAHHRTLLKEMLEEKKERERIDAIKIISEVIVK